MFSPSQPGGFYSRGGKRLFDVLSSAIALVLLSPALLIVAILVKLTSPGSALYFQQRVGRAGQLFRIVKFRSMKDNANRLGSPITWHGDTRVTPLGTVLRFLKIDELPQLWNVLKGEMSLVGPRPELPCYVDRYNLRYREVLTIRPGITDLASIKYRREERLLRQSSDPEGYYEEVILPDKLELNLSYLEERSFSRDLLILWKTLVWSAAPKKPISAFSGTASLRDLRGPGKGY